MSRPILTPQQIHPAIQNKVGQAHLDTVAQVQSLAAQHSVLVVGMLGNPFCRKARQALKGAGITHHYVQYGSYLSQWRRRNALKMWTGWPTFPMVFVKGVFVGGFGDMRKLIASGELGRLLKA